MKYQNSADAVQAPDDTFDIAAGLRLSDANIHPETGLATDYLNRFNEAVMLLDMLASCPEFRADFLAWKPMSYREHFRTSRFKTRELAIAAYDSADPDLRNSLDTLAVNDLQEEVLWLHDSLGCRLPSSRPWRASRCSRRSPWRRS